MKTKTQILSAATGVWASGLLIGANVVNYVPVEPSWPAWLLVVIGFLVGIGCFLSLRGIATTQFPNAG